ncbi:MAG: DNRLRE domain-containing protein [Opitutaceae bacterium]|jgi:hypothetical protein
MKIKYPHRSIRLLAVLTSFGIAPYAGAEVLTLTSGADSMLRSDVSSSNFGSDTGFFVGTLASSGANDLRLVFSYDLSTLLPAGATISSISFTLTQRSPDGTSADKILSLSLASLTQSFAESQVSWNNRQTSNLWTTLGGSIGTTLSTTTAFTKSVANTLVTFSSSTSFVSVAQSALDTASTFNFLVYAPDQEGLTDRALTSFYSKENGISSLNPALTITYTVAAVPEPSSVAILAGSVALAMGVWCKKKHSRLGLTQG